MTPLKAPVGVIFKPDEAKLKAAPALPMVVLAVPLVLMVVAPVTLVVPVIVAPLLRVVKPATPKVPPKVVAPVPTLKGLLLVTLVGPFRLTAPLPVPKLPMPLWLKLPLVWL